MIDDIYEITKYFPIKVVDLTLSEYIDHHINHLFKCFDNELYTSAFQHLHILYMIFIYIQLTRIAKEKDDEFKLCWIGFPTQEKDFLKNPESPLSFSQINEKTVFRFFRLVNFDDGSIGEISCFVNKRNEQLHANGKIFFHNIEDFNKEIDKYLSKMKKIILKQKSFLEKIYLSNANNYEVDYQITHDDIESQFASTYYFSEFELKTLAEDKKDIISNYVNNEM